MNQFGPVWSRMVQIGPECSRMVQSGPDWSRLVHNGPNGLGWSNTDQKWSKMALSGLKWWSKVAQLEPCWSNIDSDELCLACKWSRKVKVAQINLI